MAPVCGFTLIDLGCLRKERTLSVLEHQKSVHKYPNSCLGQYRITALGWQHLLSPDKLQEGYSGPFLSQREKKNPVPIHRARHPVLFLGNLLSCPLWKPSIFCDIHFDIFRSVFVPCVKHLLVVSKSHALPMTGEKIKSKSLWGKVGCRLSWLGCV